MAAPRILLMAYECSPYKGSEAYVGWGRVLQALREFEIDVICSRESYAAVERYLMNEELRGARFHSPRADWKLRVLRRVPRIFAYNYVAYHQWQRLAFRLAKQLHAQEPFAMVHQVNVCTFREPGYCWKMDVPFLWGPVGGTQNVPESFLAGMPPVEAFKERARTFTNQFSLKKGRVRAAARRAKVVLAANSTNKRDYEAAFGREVGLLLETGLYAVKTARVEKFLESGPLRILWSGEFTTRKALPLLLEALAMLKGTVEFELRVLGKGPLEYAWKVRAEELGVAVKFLGMLPLEKAIAQLEWAQVFVFTSLRDTSGNVVLEALGNGVPVICFDHQGVGDIVTDACGVKVAVTDPETAVRDFAAALKSVAEDRGRLVEMSAAATARAEEYLWDANGDRVNAICREMMGGSR